MFLDLGIDLGTTGVKAILADDEGNVYGSGYREYPIQVPQPGFAEQDPEEWYRQMCLAIGEAGKQAGIGLQQVRSLGFSGQMHGLVMLDRNKKLLGPAILHCDSRAGRQKARITADLGLEKMGQWVQNRVHSGFQALSLIWVREETPEVYDRIRWALCPKDYLRLRLTGEIAAERTDAAGTLLYDNCRQEWSSELLSRLQIDPAILPDPGHLPYEQAGVLTEAAGRETGLSPGIPVAYGGADQPMQALGNGLYRPGQASVTLGTSGQVWVAAANADYDPLLRVHTFSHACPNSWYVMGATLNACLAFNWLLDKVLLNRDYDAINSWAAQAPPGCGGLVFLPYLMGERSPHMNEQAKGAFLGLTLRHDRSHMIRAVMEGVLYALKDALAVLHEMGTAPREAILSGGGAKSPLWRQMAADILNLPLRPSGVREQAAMGAVLCAKMARGAFATLEEAVQALVREPAAPLIPSQTENYQASYENFQEAYRQNKNLFSRL